MKPIGTVFLLSTVFVTGAVVMALELLGARLLSVCYGASMFVWAAMISVTLLSLAVGYYAGGVAADKRPNASILYALILISGLFACAMPYSTFLVRALYIRFSVHTGTLVSSFTVFFIPLTLLGACSPFVIRLLSLAVTGAGKTAGGVYAISTLGSVVGTLATALWLIPAFGTPVGFQISGCVLIVLAAVGLVFQKGWRFAPLLLLPAAVYAIPASFVKEGMTFTGPDGSEMTLVHTTESAYGRLAVIDKEGQRLLLMNGILQTGMPIDTHELFQGSRLQYENYFLELLR